MVPLRRMSLEANCPPSESFFALPFSPRALCKHLYDTKHFTFGYAICGIAGRQSQAVWLARMGPCAPLLVCVKVSIFISFIAMDHFIILSLLAVAVVAAVHTTLTHLNCSNIKVEEQGEKQPNRGKPEQR